MLGIGLHIGHWQNPRLGAAESLPRKHLVTTTQPPSRFGSTSNRFREGLLEAIPPAVAKPRSTNIVSRSESLREQLVTENALSYVLWPPENYIFLNCIAPLRIRNSSDVM